MAGLRQALQSLGGRLETNEDNLVEAGDERIENSEPKFEYGKQYDHEVESDTARGGYTSRKLAGIRIDRDLQKREDDTSDI